jgi:hypothetical protein
MAFRLAKSTAVRTPDLIEIDVASALVLNGQAVELDGTVAVAGSPVAGIIVASYAGPTGLATDASFSPTYPKGEDGSGNVAALVMPVTGTTLIEADLAASAAVAIGALIDITAGGLTLTAGASTSDDFRVVSIVTGTVAAATVVAGFFTDPGYYTS